MGLLIYFLLTNVLGLMLVFATATALARDCGGLGRWLVLVAGAGLVACGAYRLVHWITWWHRGHGGHLAANPFLYDSPILPRKLEFLSPRMVAIVAACVALSAMGWFSNPPSGLTEDHQIASSTAPLAWDFAAASMISLAVLCAFQYYNQAVRGLKGLPRTRLNNLDLRPGIHFQKHYQFRAGSENFFTPNIVVWTKVLGDYQGKPNVQALNVGVFEGQSCLWMLENILTHPSARLTAIDPFPPADGLLPEISYRDVFLSNLRLSGFEDKVRIIEGLSQVELRRLDLESFDIIYIDGSHDPADCLEDAVIAWRLLKDGGVLIFDDYSMNAGPFDIGDKPKVAVDAFFGLFGRHFEIVHRDWQAILRKKSGRGAIC